ncbi:MAG TPA: endonuclease/exonuclease/phosphatase family protein [Planktothrix sp.]
MKKFFQDLTKKCAKAVVSETIALGSVLGAICILSFFGDIAPIIDLFSHFRCLWVLIFIVITAFALLGKRFIWAAVFAALTAANAAAIAMLWLPSDLPPLQKNVGELSLLDMNLFVDNQNKPAVLEAINKFKPDVIVLEELNPDMLAKLEPALKEYPYELCAPDKTPFGIGIFSKTKLDNRKKNPLNLAKSFVLSSDVEVGGKPITIIAMHAFPPISSYGISLDSSIISGLPALIGKSQKSVIMVGDFNSTPWSSMFRKLKGSGNLNDSEQGRGLQNSWLTIPLPIDHCLYTSDLRVLSRELGAPFGSDHLPLFCRIKVGD